MARLPLVAALALLLVVLFAREAESVSPVLLVPGATGSALWSTPTGKNKWDRLWASLTHLINIDQFFYDISLEYNPDTNTWTNITGLEVATQYFGATEAVDYLDKVDDKGVPGTDYLEAMIQFLEDTGNYTRDINIRAIPYDWRMSTSADQMDYWWSQVKVLIEDMYNDAGQEKVVIVSHCYGATTMSYWLPRQSQAWKDTYIKAHFVIAAPFTGAGIALEAAVSGSDDGYEWFGWTPIPVEDVKEAARTWGCIPALLPTLEWGNMILVSTNTRNYTAKDLPQLLLDCGATNTSVMYPYYKDDFGSFAAPGVWVYCNVGIGSPTMVGLNYPDGDFTKSAERWYADGDGTVALSSGNYCKKWKTDANTPFSYSEWPGVGHIGLVKYEPLLKELLNVLTATAPPS